MFSCFQVDMRVLQGSLETGEQLKFSNGNRGTLSEQRNIILIFQWEHGNIGCFFTKVTREELAPPPPWGTLRYAICSFSLQFFGGTELENGFEKSKQGVKTLSTFVLYKC